MKPTAVPAILFVLGSPRNTTYTQPGDVFHDLKPEPKQEMTDKGMYGVYITAISSM